MEDKCHFAHGKEELRVASDPLPEKAPYCNDQKMLLLKTLGLACLSDHKNIKKQLKDLGVWKISMPPDEDPTPESIEYVTRQAILSLTPEQIQMLVMSDKSIQSQVSLHQIIYLIENLRAIHSDNAYIINKVNIAKDMFSVQNLSTLLEIGAGIINMSDLGPETEHKHALLVKETQELANILYAKISLAAQEFIAQTHMHPRDDMDMQGAVTTSQRNPHPNNY